MRQDYVKRVAEEANELFLSGSGEVNVEAIVLAGPGDMK